MTVVMMPSAIDAMIAQMKAFIGEPGSGKPAIVNGTLNQVFRDPRDEEQQQAVHDDPEQPQGHRVDRERQQSDDRLDQAVHDAGDQREDDHLGDVIGRVLEPELRQDVAHDHDRDRRDHEGDEEPFHADSSDVAWPTARGPPRRRAIMADGRTPARTGRPRGRLDWIRPTDARRTPTGARMTAFADLVTFCLDELFALHPVIATSVGDHRYDDQWPDTSEAGRQARLAFAARWIPTFGGLDEAALSRDERIDRDLLLGELEAAVRGHQAARGRMGPDVVGLPDRRRPAPAARSRVRAAPAAAALGRRAARGDPHDPRGCARDHRQRPRPVSRLHAEIAGKRVGGVAALGRQAVETAEAAAGATSASVAVLPRLRAAADAASEALDAFGRWLTDEVAPSASGRGRAGRAAVPTSCGTRCATRRSRRPRSSPGRRRSSRPSARRWCGSRATHGRRGGR